MDEWGNWFLFLAGLVLLYYGAGWLVKGASSLAQRLGLTPLVIGLTVVAFGTSMPEMVVSVVSSLKGKSMIAVGNVIGSNICNIALVLGLSALLNPIQSHPKAVRRDIPIMLGISAYLFFITLDSQLSRLEGATLVGGIIVYSWAGYHWARRENSQLSGEVVPAVSCQSGGLPVVETLYKQIVYIVVGVGGVILGAEVLIRGAIAIMQTLGLSEKFIGLTVVAFGTSLPELATSVVAALRREMDNSIGNLVGSNVFNIMSVLGAAALARPLSVPGGFVQSGLIVDYLVMLAISGLPWVMMRRKPQISRGNGLALLACYAGYLTYLLAKA